MANYTPNYKLHQWEPEDSFLRTDFNEDFAKIDAALKEQASSAPSRTEFTQMQTQMKEKCQIMFGTYTGNGSEQTISLGAHPKAVFVRENRDGMASFVIDGGESVGYDRWTGMEIRDNGFYVSLVTINGNATSPFTNRANKTYSYAAFL